MRVLCSAHTGLLAVVGRCVCMCVWVDAWCVYVCVCVCVCG